MGRLINRPILNAGGNGLLNGLVAYWDLDDDAIDSHSTFDGTEVASPTYGAGIINNGITLSGASNQSVNFGNDSALNPSEMSVSLWFKADSIANLETLFSRQSSSSPYPSYDIRFNSSSQINPYVVCGGSAKSITSTTTFSTGTFYHLVLTVDGTDMRIYVDGSSDATPVSTGAAITGGTENTILGAHSTAGSRGFDGIIDEVGVWNRALSADEVTTLYNGGSGLSYASFD